MPVLCSAGKEVAEDVAQVKTRCALCGKSRHKILPSLEAVVRASATPSLESCPVGIIFRAARVVREHMVGFVHFLELPFVATLLVRMILMRELVEGFFNIFLGSVLGNAEYFVIIFFMRCHILFYISIADGAFRVISSLLGRLGILFGLRAHRLADFHHLARERL